MYFYCWVEICTDDVDCAQSCTIICEWFMSHRSSCRPHTLLRAAPKPSRPNSQQLTVRGSEGRFPLNPTSSSWCPTDRCCSDRTALKGRAVCVSNKLQVSRDPHGLFSRLRLRHRWLNAVHFSSVLRVTVFVISGVAAALLLTLLFILISNVTKWTKKK